MWTADALEQLIVDAELRKRIGKESEQLAPTTFNVNTICEQVGELYEEL